MASKQNPIRGEALGNNPWENVGENAQASNSPYATSPTALYGPNAQMIKDIVNDMSNEEMANGNVNFNLRPNPIYGYGSKPLDFRVDDLNSTYNPEIDDYDVPEGQDNVYWHFLKNGEDAAEWLYNFTPAQQEDIARSFTALRNYNDWQRDQSLEQQANEMRQRNLYGDTLVDLLQSTPEGQSILGEAHRPKPMARERYITGPAQW